MTVGITFELSSYAGYEEDVLDVLNRNRPELKAQNFLNWRYTAQKGPYEPVIFWVLSPSGKKIGMAGIVFRPYYIAGELYHLVILGDISLDSEYRGLGIAQELFEYINAYLIAGKHPCALVIPNEAAQKALSKSYWHLISEFTPFVYLLNPTKKILSIIKNKNLSAFLGSLAWFYKQRRLKKTKPLGFSAIWADKFDESFDTLWEKINKQNLIIRDRNTASLRSRYTYHPHNKQFRICRFFKRDDFIGYAVYKILNDPIICTTYEFIVKEKRLVTPVMNLFLNYLSEKFNIDAMRMTLNADHPYSSQLKRIGFSQRQSSLVYQIFIPNPSSLPSSHKWFLTLGDKDI